MPRPVRHEQTYILRSIKHVLQPLAVVGATLAGSRGMQKPRLAEHLVAKVPRQHRWRAQLNLAPDERAEFYLHPGEYKQTGHTPRRKLYKHIHIAGWAEPISTFRGGWPQDAAKEREPRDAVASAEVRDSVLWEVDAVDEDELGDHKGAVADGHAGTIGRAGGVPRPYATWSRSAWAIRLHGARRSRWPHGWRARRFERLEQRCRGRLRWQPRLPNLKFATGGTDAAYTTLQ